MICKEIYNTILYRDLIYLYINKYKKNYVFLYKEFFPAKINITISYEKHYRDFENSVQ